jgi:hypothetical protein
MGRRVRGTGFSGGFGLEMFLLLPQGADVRVFFNTGGGGDTIEVPSSSGRFYEVVAVDDVSKGFPTEFRIAFIVPITAWGLWPTPIP